MKRILGVYIVAALAVLFVSGVACAEVNIDYSVQLWSKYLTCSGWDVSHGKAVMETDINISNGTGFRLEGWNAKPFQGDYGDFNVPGNETDVFAAYNGMIADTKINVDVGLAYFMIPGNDMGEFFLQLQREFELTNEFSSVVHARVELNHSFGGHASQNTYWGGGLIYHINPELCWNVIDTTGVTDNGGASHTGEILLVQSSLTYKYSKALNFTVGLKNTNPFDGADVDRKRQLAVYGGIGGSF